MDFLDGILNSQDAGCGSGFDSQSQGGNYNFSFNAAAESQSNFELNFLNSQADSSCNPNNQAGKKRQDIDSEIIKLSQEVDDIMSQQSQDDDCFQKFREADESRRPNANFQSSENTNKGERVVAKQPQQSNEINNNYRQPAQYSAVTRNQSNAQLNNDLSTANKGKYQNQTPVASSLSNQIIKKNQQVNQNVNTNTNLPQINQSSVYNNHQSSTALPQASTSNLNLKDCENKELKSFIESFKLKMNEMKKSIVDSLDKTLGLLTVKVEAQKQSFLNKANIVEYIFVSEIEKQNQENLRLIEIDRKIDNLFKQILQAINEFN